MEKIKAGVIGATGYAGLEIVRLLLSHPFVEVAAVSSVSFEGRAISEIYPQLTGIFGETLANDAAVADRCDVVFGSLPAGSPSPPRAGASTRASSTSIWARISASKTRRITSSGTARTMPIPRCMRPPSTASPSCTGRGSRARSSSATPDAIPPPSRSGSRPP